MCGIYGILSLYGKLDSKVFGISDRTAILQHRGPDDYGHFADSSIYLNHRRLSIIDLQSGKQPIFNEDRSICVIFNGEIYNFQDLRNELTNLGHIFKTKSDTEVIVHSYEEWGNNCVNKFRGMFAFAIWDSKNKKLLLARDRLGIKPLFYAVLNGYFYFASEMKAILQYPQFPREIDPDGLASYFTLSYIPAPLSIFKYIRKLLPGHILEIKDGNIKIVKYWDVHISPDRTKSEKFFIDGFMGLLEESVKLRMISDVPIGAFLSGGIDSGAVVALMSRMNSSPVHTFCMGFGGNVGGYLDERKYAKKIAYRYGAVHEEYEVLPDVESIIKEILLSFDEPFADDSTVPSYYLCKITRENVKVALSGLGGDELFGGYERYLGLKLSSFYNRFPWILREKIFRQLIEKLTERKDSYYTVNHLKRFARYASLPNDMRYYGFLSSLGKEEDIFSEPEKYRDNFNNCRELMFGYFNSDNANEPLDRAFYCDIKTYLPEDILACTDRMSMWHSLEVRVPFLDHKFLEFCATIPHEMKIKFWHKKHILRKAVSELLPNDVLSHRKQGFACPMAHWLKTDLKRYVEKTLNDKNLYRHGLFDKKIISRKLSEHFNHVEDHSKLIWAVLVFQIWYNLYIENKSHGIL